MCLWKNEWMVWLPGPRIGAGRQHVYRGGASILMMVILLSTILTSGLKVHRF
ncbi:hypothetical protein BDV29DRAFT_185653 [Aspergillus leporis]|uniref:Uncharacterized protein n=1 Tax=Aspergillus leporis TaxID=41062 RepID=A0A5N5WHN5_9EURO|nr:hypothetical protein BDV29DRAFT_185653 [Aspergillus leporis]